ncbi:MAG TPA: SAM-dependent methyltransferase [Vicinamibacterales bacterium]|nr:SAM-dependent methyltransferase [Vicinamibacterales bacterium]
MTVPGLSRTCIYVAAGRAIGAKEPDSAVRNPDDLAERLLGDPARYGVDHPTVRALGLPYDEAMASAEVMSTVRMMMIRTRFIDEALERAVAAGVRQLVILGAGFDTHAYRCRDLLKDVRVFEVDRAATQALKRERVRAAFGDPPPNLTFVSIDFQHDDLGDVLAGHGHDRALPTFFIMEGVTMYVPEDGVRRTLHFVGQHPAGSGIVFDFVPKAMVDMIAGLDLNNIPPPAKPFVQRFLDLIKDEPWVFGIPLGGVDEFLGEVGLSAREVMAIGGPDSVARYLTKTDGTQVGAKAIAEAMARAAAQAASDGASLPPERRMTPERMREQQRQMAYQLVEAGVSG